MQGVSYSHISFYSVEHNSSLKELTVQRHMPLYQSTNLKEFYKILTDTSLNLMYI
jgi:hypothetical protein